MRLSFSHASFSPWCAAACCYPSSTRSTVEHTFERSTTWWESMKKDGSYFFCAGEKTFFWSRYMFSFCRNRISSEYFVSENHWVLSCVIFHFVGNRQIGVFSLSADTIIWAHAAVHTERVREPNAFHMIFWIFLHILFIESCLIPFCTNISWIILILNIIYQLLAISFFSSSYWA